MRTHVARMLLHVVLACSPQGKPPPIQIWGGGEGLMEEEMPVAPVMRRDGVRTPHPPTVCHVRPGGGVRRVYVVDDCHQAGEAPRLPLSACVCGYLRNAAHRLPSSLCPPGQHSDLTYTPRNRVFSSQRPRLSTHARTPGARAMSRPAYTDRACVRNI